MTTIHGGNIEALAAQAGCAQNDILDFSASLNPLGPPDCVQSTIMEAAAHITPYPEPTCATLTHALATFYKVPSSQVVPGRGATELLFAIPQIIDAKRALIVAPCYGDYATACTRARIPIEYFLLNAATNFCIEPTALSKQIRPNDLLFIGRPNNPTGKTPSTKIIDDLCTSHPKATFVVDESFIEFTDYSSMSHPQCPPNCIIIRSLTKFFAIAGIRLGAAISNDIIASKLKKQILPWSIDTISQKVGVAVLQDLRYQTRSKKNMGPLRQSLQNSIDRIPTLSALPSDANFLLIKASPTVDVQSLCKRLLEQHHIAVRPCTNFHGLNSSYFRIAVRNRDDNQRLINALKSI